MRRHSWLILLSLVAGLAVGLAYAWAISPIRYVDTTPNTLRADFKDAFRAAIAASYSSTHNLERTRARLALLGDPNPAEALTAQAQRMLAAGESSVIVQEVAGLASDLGSGVASVSASATAIPTSNLPTPVLPAITSSSAAATGTSDAQTLSVPTETAAPTLVFDTPTARPTRTPIPKASAPFELLSQDPVCNPNLTDGLMQISVLDSHRHQMPGVEITISWSGVEESFFTGLKPEIADGYADYVMQAGVSYALRIARNGTPVSGLSAPSCPDTNGQTYVGGLKLVFRQP
jgi:hypothetical protein